MRPNNILSLDNKLAFHHPFMAMEHGLIDITKKLSPEYILMAYRWGIFPWVNDEGYFLWFFLSPRLVLFPSKLHVPKSMNTYFNNDKYRVTYDREFELVMRKCRSVYRRDDAQSWIDDDFIENYTRLHKMGYAHSVEVWLEDKLVGGLYGIAMGKVFYGESMFSIKPNASKFGFISLVRALESRDFKLVDCQQDTPHLRSLGAELISKEEFLDALRQNMLVHENAGIWPKEGIGIL